MAQLTRRMRESWGDRSTMDKAAQRVMRSIVQWGLLVDETEKGVYAKGRSRVSVSGELAGLLLEGLLIYEGKVMPVGQIGMHPVLFPFDVDLNSHELRRSDRFEVHRQGLDVDVVGLAVLEGPQDSLRVYPSSTDRRALAPTGTSPSF